MSENVQATAGTNGQPIPLTKAEGQAQKVRTNENKNHNDEKLGLLSSCPHTGVTDDTNADTGSQTRQTVGETGGEVGKTKEVRIVNLGDVTDKNDCDDKPLQSQNDINMGPPDTHISKLWSRNWRHKKPTPHRTALKEHSPQQKRSIAKSKAYIDTKDTSHNNWDNRTHDELRAHDTHRGDANTGFRGSICGTKVRENQSRSSTGEPEKARRYNSSHK